MTGTPGDRMANPYDKYLERLRGRIQEDPYMQQARRTAFATAPKQASFDTYLRKENVPVGVASQMELDQQAQRQQAVTGVVERAGAKDVARKEQIKIKLDELEFKKEEYEEREKEIEEQKKEGLWSTGLQVAGAVAGGIAGSVIPGVGTMAGASLGASAGQILGGFTGDNSEDISAGLGSAIQTFSAISTTNEMKDLGAKSGKVADLMMNLPEGQREALLYEWNTMIATGNYEGLDDLLKKYSGYGNFGGESIAVPEVQVG